MFKMSHKALIIFSGFIWFAVGSFLLPLGLNFLFQALHNVNSHEAGSYPLLNLLGMVSRDVENIVAILIAVALLIGYSKGRYVLGKTAIKGVERIRSLPNPSDIRNLYSAKYYLLIAVMIGLGVSMKYLGIPTDVRGFIDVAVGSALINGAMIYFRMAFEKRVVSE